MMTLDDFRPYQLWMSNLVYGREYVYLGADMGLGKTAAVLWAVRRLLDQGVVSKVLIVAPLYVAENTWPDEIVEWDFARPLSFSVMTGTDKEREAARMEPTEVHIINRENIVWLWRKWGRKWPYDMLVYDEASRLKAGSPRTKPQARKDGTVGGPKLSSFGALCRARIWFKRIVEMSGTPAPNGLRDLWGQIYLLDQGERLGRTKTAFQQRWFNMSRDGPIVRLEPKDHAHREIMGSLKDIMVSLKTEDYLQLPPVVVNKRWVKFSTRVMSKYKEFERTSFMEEYDVEAVNKGVLVNKLLQFANGSIYQDDRTAQPIHDLKLIELESIVAEANGAPIMVAYSYQFDLDNIKRKFPKVRVFGDRKDDMKDWNAGRIPILVLHPASAGHGLNFQHGGNIAVWYGLNWSLELYHQFNKRLHRSGQKAERVFLHHILARGTADEDVMRALNRKGATQDAIMDAVRVRLENLV